MSGRRTALVRIGSNDKSRMTAMQLLFPAANLHELQGSDALSGYDEPDDEHDGC